VVLGLSNGQALVFHHTYKITYPDNKKTITPASTTPTAKHLSCWTRRAVRWNTSASTPTATLVLAGSTGSHLQVLSLTAKKT
jgi:phosphate transport system permease protein